MEHKPYTNKKRYLCTEKCYSDVTSFTKDTQFPDKWTREKCLQISVNCVNASSQLRLNPSSATVGKTSYTTRPQSEQNTDCLQEDKNCGATKLSSNIIIRLGHNNRPGFESIKLLTLTHSSAVVDWSISAVIPRISQQGKGKGFITKACVKGLFLYPILPGGQNTPSPVFPPPS